MLESEFSSADFYLTSFNNIYLKSFGVGSCDAKFSWFLYAIYIPTEYRLHNNKLC